VNIRLRWKQGGCKGLHDVLVFSATKTEFARYRDLPRASLAALRLRRMWPGLDGAVGVGLQMDVLRRRSWSVSIWSDEGALTRFLQSPAHVETVTRFRERVEVRSRTWTASRTSPRGAWAEAKRRLP
jgi:hypothetical protein